MIDFSRFNNLVSLVSYFSRKDACEQAIIDSRWGNGNIICPYCGKPHCKKSKNGRFHCTRCNRHFSCLVGTIFENTKISLVKWFTAMYLISSHKKGISSYQLAKDIDVTQKTAWYMLQKIRTLYRQYEEDMFYGTVECDEVYIGGKEKWKHKSMRTPHTQGRSTKTKTPVFGMVVRDQDNYTFSIVHAFAVDKVDKKTIQSIIREFVYTGSMVITDEHNAYNGLENLGYWHSVVKHSKEEYVDGNIFTNSIEGFWSHFRRMISGCYHNISDEHLQSYIDEACYRWNTRKASSMERFSDMFSKSIGYVIRQCDIKLCEAA